MVIFNVGSTSFCVKQALKKMLHSCARCCFLRKLTLEISPDLQRRSNNNSPAFHVKRDTSGRGKDSKKRPRRGPMKDNVGNDDFPDTYVLDPYRVLLLCTFPSGCRRTLLLFDILRMSEISFDKAVSANKIISKTTTQKLVEP